MSAQHVYVEQFGEGDSGAVLRWAVDDGSHVTEGGVIASLSTDKAVLEMVSPAAGTITKLVSDDARVKVGDIVAIVGEYPAAAKLRGEMPTPTLPRRVTSLPPSTSPFRDRLVAEWRKHGTLIIALDFDDTVYPWGMRDGNSLVRQQQVLNLLRECQETGAKVVPWTCSDESRHPFILAYLRENGIDPSPINENIPGLPFGNSRKVYANVYLDDRGGLTEAMNDLAEALKIVRSGRVQTLR